MIQFEKVAFKYPGADHYALVNVTLEIPQGSFFALLGPNGAGKTTLLRLLCGRFSRAAHDGDAKAKKLGGEGFTGDLIVAPAFRNADGFLNARCYGVLLENPGVYPKLSIEEYLSYFAGFYGMGENACMPSGMARARVEELAERLELPALQSRLSTLSLGNRQKVQIVRALVHNPKVLILDEPVANLDPNAREMVWKLIAEWREKEGGTAIVCSHILAEMEEEPLSMAVASLRRGSLRLKVPMPRKPAGTSSRLASRRKLRLSKSSRLLPKPIFAPRSWRTRVRSRTFTAIQQSKLEGVR